MSVRQENIGASSRLSQMRSAVIMETYRAAGVEITVIVHSENESVTKEVHEACRSAVERIMAPMEDANWPASELTS